ncbi:MAG: hypothetical protein K6G42_04400 [Lachnospiraceae bacterium]|nr:hypothetical protein [Lachnospiraceae bacterium]
MGNLIRADIQRIFKTGIMRLMFPLTFVIVLATAFYVAGVNDNVFNFVYREMEMLQLLGCLVFGPVVFRCVFVDEFRVMAITTAIGFGFTRKKIYLAKIVDSYLIMLFLNLFAMVMLFGVGAVCGYFPDMDAVILILVDSVYSVYFAEGTVIFSALVLYISNNIPLSYFSYFLISLLIPAGIYYLEYIPFFARLHISRYIYYGLGDMAATFFFLNMPAEGMIMFVTGTLAYLGLAVFFSIKYLEKKELDF